MRQHVRSALATLTAIVVVFPVPAFAQMAPTTLVERTPSYTMVLAVGPAESMVSSMDAMHGMSGEVAVDGESAGMMADQPDQGMAVNHHLEVHITQGDSDAAVMDVIPTVRITDKATGESRDLLHVMGMYGSSMGMTDFHFGQNVWLPDGTYLVSVKVGPESALFRDVEVVDTAMMTDHDMAP